jgi:hypothetical protein
MFNIPGHLLFVDGVVVSGTQLAIAANEILPAYGRIAYTTGRFTTSVKVEEDAFQH